MAHRHAARVGGILLTVGAVVVALVAGTVEPIAALGVVPLLAVGLLFVLGGFRDSISVGPLTVPWYGLIGAGFVGIGVYLLTGVAASPGGGVVFGVVLPVLTGLCSCWLGIQYARGSALVGIEPEAS